MESASCQRVFSGVSGSDVVLASQDVNSITPLADNRYEVVVVGDSGAEHTVICTVVSGKGVSGIQLSPLSNGSNNGSNNGSANGEQMPAATQAETVQGKSPERQP